MNSLGRKDREDKQSVFTKETLGVVLVLFSALLTVCLITREKVFYSVGKAVNSFLFGCFGYFAFAVMVFIFIEGILLVLNKKTRFSAKFKFVITVMFTMIALLGQVISIKSGDFASYGKYLEKAYMMADAGGIATCSAGGLMTGLICYPLNELLSNVGSYVVLSCIIAVCVYFALREYSAKIPAKAKKEKFRGSYAKKQKDEDLGIEISGEIDYPIGASATVNSQPTTQKLFVSNAEDFALKTKRELNKGASQAITLGKTEGGLYMGGYGNSYLNATSSEMQKKIEYIKTPAKIDFNQKASTPQAEQTLGTTVSDYIPLKKQPIESKVEEQLPQIEQPKSVDIPMYFHDQEKEKKEDSASEHAQAFADKYAEVEEVVQQTPIKTEPEEIFRPVENIFSPKPVEEEVDFSEPIQDQPQFIQREQVEDIEEFNDTPQFEEIEPKAEEPDVSSIIKDRRARSIFAPSPEEEQKSEENEEPKVSFTSRARVDGNGLGVRREVVVPEIKVEEEKPKKPAPPINRVYNAPPLDLLETYDSRIDDEGENHAERMEIIRRTLENFHISTEPVGYIQGPTVTRYELRMPHDVPVKKVLNHADDLKMRLQSFSEIRIQAPVPGKDVIGVEVSNKHPVTVGLRELLEGTAGKPSKKSSLIFSIGKDVVGEAIIDDLVKGPHYLVAGGTGSGKSVCLNIMIVSMIMRYSPEDLQLILIDPKLVEFTTYEHLPHLVLDEIISDPKRAIAAFQWAIVEMERRYKLFSDNRVRSIDDYNEHVASATVAKLPKIVIVVDELSNLMEMCKRDMEAKILSIAQKARAAGIHLVLATQRPSVDIITGTIKANLPSRIGLRLSNAADSQTILSEAGAEKLLGNGDMLYKNGTMNEAMRYQGAFISSVEIQNVVDYIIKHNVAYFNDDMKEFLDESTKEKEVESSSGLGNNSYDINDVNAGDPIFLQALWLAVNTGTVAVSQLQRRFRLGYGRAGALVDRMEQLKLVSGNEGSKARRVLITREEFLDRFGPVDDTY